MPKGYVCLVLHAHLPYVRHPEHEFSLEEKWFFEGITETYLPLIKVFSGLIRDDIDFRLTISLSPTLVSMLSDEFLQQRYINHLEKLLELADKEVHRTQNDLTFNHLARMYQDQFLESYYLFKEKYRGNILTAFKEFQDAGKLEIITCAATHGYFPLIGLQRESIYAQAVTAIDLHTKTFGKPPKGFWIPECAYNPGDEEILKDLGIKYFFTDTHGITYATPKPKYGAYNPILCPSEIAVFGRDPESTKQVWSRDEGYPGDFYYRDFYRDIGFDLDFDYVKPYIHPDSIRIHTGFKYHRITGTTDHKEPYEPEVAMEKTAEHAGNFMFNREKQIEWLSGLIEDRPPIVVSPYDAELFGHWWYEGPRWIDYLLRKIDCDQDNIKTITPSEYLGLNHRLQVCTPCGSSWGNKGYHEVWLNRTNDWTYRHLHKAAERMREMADCYPKAEGDLRNALNQAARELLLAQASDWPFIMNADTMVTYAVNRFNDHISRFTRLYDDIMGNKIDPTWVNRLYAADNIFPDIDYRIYRSLQDTALVEKTELEKV